jgi:hypothetical protein
MTAVNRLVRDPLADYSQLFNVHSRVHRSGKPLSFPILTVSEVQLILEIPFEGPGKVGIVAKYHIVFFLIMLDAYTLPHNKMLCPVDIGCILTKFRVNILHSWHLLSVAFPKILIIDIMVSASLPDSVLWIFLSNASSSLVK